MEFLLCIAPNYDYILIIFSYLIPLCDQLLLYYWVGLVGLAAFMRGRELSTLVVILSVCLS